MNASIVRRLWSVVETSPAKFLLSLSDSDLVTQLLQRLEGEQTLSPEDSKGMQAYLTSRTLLIRDLAQSRLEEYLDWSKS